MLIVQGKFGEGLSENKDLKNVIVNFSTLQLKYETDTLTKEQVEKLVKAIEPDVTLEDINETSKSKNNYSIIRFIIGIIFALLGFFGNFTVVIKEIFIVSAIEIKEGKKEEDKDSIVGVEVTVAPGEKCERCWMYSETVGEDQSHPHVCHRCSENLK